MYEGGGTTSFNASSILCIVTYNTNAMKFPRSTQQEAPADANSKVNVSDLSFRSSMLYPLDTPRPLEKTYKRTRIHTFLHSLTYALMVDTFVQYRGESVSQIARHPFDFVHTYEVTWNSREIPTSSSNPNPNHTTKRNRLFVRTQFAQFRCQEQTTRNSTQIPKHPPCPRRTKQQARLHPLLSETLKICTRQPVQQQP